MSINGTAANGSSIPVIDYEGSRYRTEFWEGQGRDYEDAVERLALRRLMPPAGVRIAELGAGFGRLGDLYLGYDQVVLFDYSRTLLEDAARRWGGDGRFVFVAGNLYELPLASGVLDTVVMVRVMHHLQNVPQALAQICRVMHGQSLAVLEYANKRNFKALLRWAGRRQAWSPFSPEPLEYVRLNFDFHPVWMQHRMEEAGLRVRRRYGVSHFRLPLFKNRVPADRLAQVDSRLFGLGGIYPLAPSVFVQAELAPAARRMRLAAPVEAPAILRCPACGREGLRREDDDLVACPQCEKRYARKQSVWDFKEPV